MIRMPCCSNELRRLAGPFSILAGWGLYWEDFNAFSYRRYNSGGMQVAGSLQDSSLVVTPRRFDEGINSQFEDIYLNKLEFMFRSDIYITYLNEEIVGYRKARDEILALGNLSPAQDKASKSVRLQNKLLTSHEEFDAIWLIHFSWDHSVNKLSRLSSVAKSYSKNAVVKNKHALRYLCVQERFCRVSGLAQRITPAMLSLRAK